MEREKGDGNTILLTVIGVATLLVALVGATFAYFSTQVNNESNQSVSIQTAAPAGLQYLGQQFEMENILPGTTNTEAQGKFEVTNPEGSSFAQTYDLKLVIDENTLNNQDGDGQLLMTITSTDATVAVASAPTNVKTVTNGVEIDLTNGAAIPANNPIPAPADYVAPTSFAAKEYLIVNDQRIEPGVTQEYSMILNFVNFEETTQDYNQGKTFRAHIDLVDAVTVK